MGHPIVNRYSSGGGSEDLGEASAVDGEAGTGDVAAGVAGEEEGGADQLVGLAPAAQGGAAGEFVLLLLREEAGGEVGQEGARGDAVDRDPERAQVVGAGAGQAQQALLVAE